MRVDVRVVTDALMIETRSIHLWWMSGFDAQMPSEVNTYSHDETSFHKGMRQKHFLANDDWCVRPVHCKSKMLDPFEIISCSISISQSDMVTLLFLDNWLGKGEFNLG